jgi:hypothetical protein
MSELNVDDFFVDAARALLSLYGVFPRRHALFVDDIYHPEEPDEFGLHSDRYRACFGALVWLGEEAYIRFEETIRDEAIDQAVLTGRCFTLLSSPAGVAAAASASPGAELPKLVRLERSTHAARLREALKERSSMALRTAMLAFMHAFMHGMERSGPRLPEPES